MATEAGREGEEYAARRSQQHRRRASQQKQENFEFGGLRRRQRGEESERAGREHMHRKRSITHVATPPVSHLAAADLIQ
jgi:hypothetical protein